MSHSAPKTVPLPILIGLLLILLAFAAIVAFLYANRPQPTAQTESDNKTSEVIFDELRRRVLVAEGDRC